MSPEEAVQMLEAMRKKHQEAQQRYYEKHKEARRQYAKQYYEAHKDKVLERVKRTQKKRKEETPAPALPASS